MISVKNEPRKPLLDLCGNGSTRFAIQNIVHTLNTGHEFTWI